MSGARVRRPLSEHYQVNRATARTWLQDAGIAIRNTSSPGSADRTVLADLYGDPAILELCTRHQLPLRPTPGSRTTRFPTPVRLTDRLLREAYLEVGLSVSHICLLTGHRPDHIRAELRAHHIPLRGNARSPWTERRALGSVKKLV